MISQFPPRERSLMFTLPISTAINCAFMDSLPKLCHLSYQVASLPQSSHQSPTRRRISAFASWLACRDASNSASVPYRLVRGCGPLVTTPVRQLTQVRHCVQRLLEPSCDGSN